MDKNKRFSLYESGGFWAVLENEVNDGTISVKSYCGAELIINRMNELAEDIKDLKAQNLMQAQELGKHHVQVVGGRFNGKNLIDSMAQQIEDLKNQLKHKYPYINKYDNGIFVEYNVVYEREGIVATTCFGKNKELAEKYLKQLKGEKL